MNLTPTQLRAVATDSREVLIVAGAGSGKTATMAARVAHLLANGATPDQFLVLTFTRKAAREMRDRIQSASGNDMAGAMIGTFHSVALSVLRRHADRLGYNPDTMTTITPDDQDLLLALACRDLGYLKGKDKWATGLSMKRVQSALDAYYTGMKLEKPDARLDVVVQRYGNMLYNMNALDFGSMLKETNRLFAECPDVLAEYRGKIKHVLVDELQDADETQYILHHWFDEATFFGVGDPRQTIYQFRGARPDLMRTKHKDAEVIDLCECFRCGNFIVEFANRLISHNGDFPPLVGATGRAGAAWMIGGRTADIIDEASKQREFGYQWSDIAILSRNHKGLERLEWKAKEAGVPVYRVGKAFDITTTDEFRNVLAALRLVVNPRDDLAFLRLATYVSPTIQGEELAQLRGLAAAAGESLFTTLVTSRSSPGELWENIASCWRAGDADRNVVEVACGIGSSLPLSEKYARCMGFWTDHCGSMSVCEALEWYTLKDSQDDVNTRDAVTLITCHAAKGLEWPVVVVCNLNEGTFPSSRAIREPGGIESERNVAYVALTRARERLVMHWRSPEDQAEREGGPDPQSRYIGEAMGAV